ncbi:cytochrome c [Cognatiyoonia koreensis]|uniref:Cytochrome c n=1 Tax=Cognatiyoonia koreensis TaxID=364200 RepID=A0A1I0PYU9_9RHOB|nr:c-type cytochrome [Cognatiyoonia koreensis]SEW19651.1 cytochrome c [Cognatiyoonia koreensis]
MLKFLKLFIPAGAGTASVLTLAYFLADQFVTDMPAPMRGTLIQPANAQETAAVEPDPTEEGATVVAGGLGLGRLALEEEVAAWDIDVRPDGLGLPAGSGDVWTGEEVFVEKCAACHGDFGEAVGRWPVLAGGLNTLSDDDPVKTIGSYWPYLSTVYDYVNRAMPFGEAQSLEPDEIYAITAYLLYVNDLVEDDFTLSNENFLDVQMPNVDNFYMDDRLTVEMPLFQSADVCMENCKDSVEITMNAMVLDVTPETETAETTVVEEVAEEVVEETAVEEVAVEDAAAAGPDPALVAAGEGAFRACKACHQVGEGAVNRSGPHLNDVLGRTIGSVDGFRYSATFADAMAAGDVWTKEALAAFLTDPKGAMPGTKMSFRGVRNEEDIAALTAYLQSFAAE